MEEQRKDLTVGLNADLQEIVDVLARGGYETYGIAFERVIDCDRNRSAYTVTVTKAVPKNVRANPL